MRYQVKNFHAYLEQDEYKTGVRPETSHNKNLDMTFSATTQTELVQNIANFFDVGLADVSLNACEEAGRIDIQCHETDAAMRPTSAELDDWRHNKKRLWLVTYTGQLEITYADGVTWENLAGTCAA